MAEDDNVLLNFDYPADGEGDDFATIMRDFHKAYEIRKDDLDWEVKMQRAADEWALGHTVYLVVDRTIGKRTGDV